MTAAASGRQGAARVPDTDAELWARGDQAAFGALFDRHAEAVWNHAYRLTASWSLAEDLTSATFLAAWRRRSRRVLEVVPSMPKAEREAVELVLLGELSTVEAVEVLGVAEVSVRSRISRALGPARCG